MKSNGLTEEAKLAFEEIYADIPEVKGLMIATFEGLPVVADFKGGLSGDKVAALSATAVNVGKRIMPQLGLGDVSELTVSSNDGKIFLYMLGNSALLCILTPKSVNLGMVFMKANEVAKRLSNFV